MKIAFKFVKPNYQNDYMKVIFKKKNDYMKVNFNKSLANKFFLLKSLLNTCLDYHLVIIIAKFEVLEV